MKSTIVSILAAMAIMASGTMVPSAFAAGMDKGKTSDTKMYDSGKYSSSRSMDDMSQTSGSFKVSKMMGKEVRGMQGNKLGKIKDFVVDPNGHIFALLSRDDMSGKTVAIPFEAFSSTGMEKDHLSLNITKDQLAGAPEFSQNTLADRTWSEGVYRHFGIQPRWSDQGMTGQSGMSGSYQSGTYQGSQDQSLQGSGQDMSGMGGQSSQPKTNY